MNEHGLTVGGFYHPEFADYGNSVTTASSSSLNSNDLVIYLLSTCSTVVEAIDQLSGLRISPGIDFVENIEFPAHFIIGDSSGRSIVIEIVEGVPRVFEAPLGVITNAPNYDWHMINLRNYLNLSAVSTAGVRLGGIDFDPLGAGSGMLGLPGDFTPVSRFVRAAFWSQNARTTHSSDETLYELFRILDNFNVPVQGSEGSVSDMAADLRSGTQVTIGYDVSSRCVYYHTKDNRRLRRVDLRHVDFNQLESPLSISLDIDNRQDVEDITEALLSV